MKGKPGEPTLGEKKKQTQKLRKELFNYLEEMDP